MPQTAKSTVLRSDAGLKGTESDTESEIGHTDSLLYLRFEMPKLDASAISGKDVAMLAMPKVVDVCPA